jgi:hypothetical protein
MTQSSDRPVVITTAHREVYFGYLVRSDAPKSVQLRAARNCLYWSRPTRGVVGLAAIGPQPGSRVGPPANIELYDITAIMDCTPGAVAAWESEPWEM